MRTACTLESLCRGARTPHGESVGRALAVLSVLALAVAALPTVRAAPSCVNGLDPQALAPLPSGGDYTGPWGASPRFLYNGSNDMPASHRAAGEALAGAIRPLDRNGLPDSTTGWTVVLVLGMSNTRLEFDAFVRTYIDTRQASPFVAVVNGAFPGYTAERMVAPGTIYWNGVNQTLTTAGFTNLQPQVLLVKISDNLPQNADGSPQGPTPQFQTAADKAFPTHALKTEANLHQILKTAKALYPNVKLAYLTSRMYGGWSCAPTETQYREPVAYGEGFSAKWAIQAQVDGDPDLAYAGPSATAPWLAWGPYLWNSSWPQNWFQGDGTHPNTGAQQEVSRLFYDFLTTDSTSASWFAPREPPTVTATVPADGATNVPRTTPVSLTFDKPMETASVEASLSVNPSVVSASAWSGGNTTLMLAPLDPLRAGTSYTITIAAGARAEDGTDFGFPFAFAFRTAAPSIPVIVTTFPASGTDEVPTTTLVRLRFSVPMDRASTERAISVSPPVAFYVRWTPSDDIVEIAFAVPLNRSVTYTVRVDPTAASREGAPMAAPFVLTFTTTSTGGGEVASASFNWSIALAVAAVAVGVTAILLRPRRSRPSSQPEPVPEEDEQDANL